MKVAPNTARILKSVPLPDEVSAVHTNAIVVDMGSHTTRLGFSGDDTPRFHERTLCRQDGSAYYDAAFASTTDPAKLSAPIHNGTIIDWDGFEGLLQRIDDMVQLGDPEQSAPVLLSEKALIPASQRQRVAELLFEKHGVTAASFALSPVLALYASGLSTGLSIEIGHEQCHIAPAFQGLSLFHATHCLGLGGANMTDLFTQTATASHVELPSTTVPGRQRDVWQYTKEKTALAATSAESYRAIMNGQEKPSMTSCRLPDGTVLSIGSERYQPCEILFQPTLLSHMAEDKPQATITSEVQLRTAASPRGIHELLVDSAKRCDADLLPFLYDNILLSGGGSLIQGLPTRLEDEVQALLPPSSDRVRVMAGTERGNAVFAGGSILASLSSFQSLWVSRADYDEVGSIAVVRGCL